MISNGVHERKATARTCSCSTSSRREDICIVSIATLLFSRMGLKKPSKKNKRKR
jgi:hypothetical protein